jgi:hypothetical protein
MWLLLGYERPAYLDLQRMQIDKFSSLKPLSINNWNMRALDTSKHADQHIILTSTRAQYLLSSFDVIWTASEWNCEFSPTKIRVLHWSCFSCSVKSYLLENHFRSTKYSNSLSIGVDCNHRNKKMENMFILIHRLYKAPYVHALPLI